MKKPNRALIRSLIAALVAILCPWPSAADQDPPGRVARVTDI